MITDLKAFCELFYASTSIPIGYYHASPDDDCSFPSILEDPSVFKGILSGFLFCVTICSGDLLFYRAVLQLLWLYKAGAC